MAIYLKKAVKENLFSRLVKSNSGYSSKSFLLIVVTIIGALLLCVPIFCLSIEAWFTHTISTDLTAMAAYITAVAALFTSVGLTKVWSEKYEHRLPGPDGKIGTDDDTMIDVTDEEYDKIMKLIDKSNKQEET